MSESSIMVAYHQDDIPNHLISLKDWASEIQAALQSVDNWVVRYSNFPKAIAVKVGVGRGSLLFDKGSLNAWRDERTMKRIENIQRNIARETRRLKKFESVLQTKQTTKGEA